MQKLVTNGDLCTCSSGNTPCPIVVTDLMRKMKSEGRAVVISTDSTVSNMCTFGMCNNLSNPAVKAATLANQGILTSVPCVPVLMGSWTNCVKKTKINGVEIVGEESTLKCTYGSSIKISKVSNRKLKSE